MGYFLQFSDRVQKRLGMIFSGIYVCTPYIFKTNLRKKIWSGSHLDKCQLTHTKGDSGRNMNIKRREIGWAHFCQLPEATTKLSRDFERVKKMRIVSILKNLCTC